ncbi:unnamed protein product, partial [Adineta steineri]
SLAAVSLYNWLGQETGIYISLTDLLQGLSIETIATLVYNKLNEKEQTKSSAAKEQDSDFDLVNENEVQFSNTSTYTGLENIICLRRSNQNNTSTLFCITQISNDNNNEDLFTLFIQKLSNQKNKISSNDMYALQISSSLSSSSISTYAQNLITQMRRIQSCGSYQIVAIRKKPEETIAHEIYDGLLILQIDSTSFFKKTLSTHTDNLPSAHILTGHPSSSSTTLSTRQISVLDIIVEFLPDDTQQTSSVPTTTDTDNELVNTNLNDTIEKSHTPIPLEQTTTKKTI